MTTTWQPAPDQTRRDIEDRRAVRAAVFAFLRDRGPRGALTSELVSRFGMSAVKRLHDIKAHDPEWDYERVERVSATDYRYVLVRRPQPEPPPAEGWLF